MRRKWNDILLNVVAVLVGLTLAGGLAYAFWNTIIEI